MQSENLLRSECGGYESDDSGGGGRGAPPGPPGYYPPPQHQYQVLMSLVIVVFNDADDVPLALLATIHPLSTSIRYSFIC